ncbi:MAG: efflux RND transporter periplasmic adaptor subunit [Nitrospirae bacterium]|nr:efflux RND transporter periplasmic adaptor subunit [Nitrospirota bacterium]
MVIVVMAVVYGFWPKSVPVDGVKVSRGVLMVTVEEEGKTRVKDRFVVSAPVAGFLRRIEWEAGDPVKKGEVVAVLEPLRSSVLDPRSQAEAQSAVAAAKSALEAAAAEADYARTNFERMKKLYEEGDLSKSAFDQAETRRRSSEAAVNVARSEMERAEAVLSYSASRKTENTGDRVMIPAPVSSRVLKIVRESAGVVNAGETIMEIGDPEKLEVVAEVLSADAVKIKPGTPVLFERWGGGDSLKGTVRTVEPAGFTKISSLGVEEQRVLVVVDIASPQTDWQGLGDGYRVEARFVLWERTNVLQVPTTALFRMGEGWAVYVMDKGRARQRAVTVGHQNGLNAEIVSGLSEGETIVAHPDDAVADKVRVKTR